MRSRRAVVVSWFLACLPAALASGEIEFTKKHIDATFRSEGIAVADVDGDAKTDILAGPLWYKAPDWKPHEISAVKQYNGENGYSESFCCFADDLNRDGRPDLIVVGFPGLPVRIYENPGPEKLGSHWKEHQAFPSCTNESPHYLDLDGDGRRELLCGFEPEERMAWFAPGAKMGDPWTCYPFSGPKAAGAQRYYHGLGAGDINKDGRLDVVIPHGWYEAPADRKAPDWKLHPISPSPASAHVLVYDFDGDGDQDLLGSSAHAHGIWWYEQSKGADGSPQWQQHEIDKSYSQTHALVAADINKDGLPDFVTGKRFWAHGPKGDPDSDKPAVLHWYELQRKDGKPAWTRHTVDGDSGVGTQFEVADVNMDGLLDVAISNKKGVFLLEQKAAPKAD
ncbi:MAG: VCBS repeat-containing protein [Planctomycetes bacterium]|nr:VCBS repeat-containing protein [Planctomycetota bacterium]